MRYHIFTLTFSSLLLTYQLLVPLKLNKRRKVAQLSQNLNLILLENLELLGYPAPVRQGSLRVRRKGKLHFKLINFPKKLVTTKCIVRYYLMAYYKERSCKISLQTWRTFNLSPNNFFW